MRKYEGMFILKPDMNSDDLKKAEASIEEAITKHKGRVERLDKWARRRLAFSIKKYLEGEYYLCVFEADPAAIPSLKEAYRLNDNVLRVLIVVKEK